MLGALKEYILTPEGRGELPDRPRAVALGLFDGLHLGHRAVISRASGREMDGRRLASCVYTFHQPPSALFKGDAGELCSPAQKKQVLQSMGVEELVQADFSAVRELSPEQFVEEVLHGLLDARLVSCGFNYRFGRGGSGDAALLTKLCARWGIQVVTVPAVEIDGQPVSSSRIRRLVEQGDMPQAARLLGRPFRVDFPVVTGQKLGRVLGTPTINQPLPEGFVHPRFGVYASSVETGGEIYHGVTNVGMRPTVADRPGGAVEQPLVETWIPDFSGDLYGREVPVSLVKFLRPEQKFDSLEELKARIFRDGEEARQAVLGSGRDRGIRAVLFDFDDTLQDRPAAFKQYTAFFMDKYFPSLPAEQRREREEEMLRRNNGGYVNYLEYFCSLFESWGWHDAPEAGEIYREFQFRFPEYATLFPETVPVLEELRRRGYRLGVITNGPSMQQNRKLDVAGVRTLLDIAVVSGDEQVHKPDPEIFRRTAARLGVPCSCCVYVGDHPVNDVQGSAAAGMKPVYINPFYTDTHPEGVPEIHTLTELLDLLPAEAKW